MSLDSTFRRSIPDRGKSEYEGPKTGEHLEGLGDREEEALVTGVEGRREGGGGRR